MTELRSIVRTLLEPLAEEELGLDEVAEGICESFGRLLDAQIVVLCTHDPVDGAPRRLFRRAGGRRAPRSLQSRLARAFCARDLSGGDALSVAVLRERPGGADAYAVASRRGDEAAARGLPLPLRLVGLRDELRVLLADDSGLWGSVSVVRHGGTFDELEVEAVAALASTATPCVRRATQRAWTRRDCVDRLGPGVAALGPLGELLELDEQASALLGGRGPEPVQLWSHALSLRAAMGESATTTTVGACGGLRATFTALGGQPVVILQPARGRHYAERVLRGLPLTPREDQVTRGVCRGWDNRRIAFELDMADATVKVHLRSVYAKVGVSGRQELSDYVHGAVSGG